MRVRYRLGVILSMEDRFDYQEFVNRCISEGIAIMPMGEFAQKVGILMMALREYPEIEPMDAYMKVINEKNVSDDKQISNNKKSCCGGGKVR